MKVHSEMPDELARRLARGSGAEVDDLIAALFMAAEESFFYADLADGTLTWSRGVEVSLGYPPNAVGRTLEEWRERVHPDDLERLIERVRASLRAGARVWNDHLRVARADGSYASASVHAVILRPVGRAPGVLGAVTFDAAPDDRAELLRSIDDLLARSRLAERRRDLIVKAVSDAVYEWDPASDVVTRSAGWHGLFGYEDTPIGGGYEWWIERVHPDDRERVHASVTRFLGGDGADTWVATYRFRCADDSYVWVQDRGYAVSRVSAEPPRMIGAVSRSDPPDAEQRPVFRVTPRQAAVLELVRGGETNKQIALRLGISEQAVKEHVSRLFERFAVPNRAALVAVADAARIEVS